MATAVQRLAYATLLSGRLTNGLEKATENRVQERNDRLFRGGLVSLSLSRNYLLQNDNLLINQSIFIYLYSLSC